MKYLITGGAGFVGAHLIDSLRTGGHQVVSVDAAAPHTVLPGVDFRTLSLIDRRALEKLLADVRPDRIVHLASASSVAFSWEKPMDCFMNNTNIFLNLVEAVRQRKLSCRILSVGSSEEYGPVKQEDIPLREAHALNPMSPYAVARVAQEHLSVIYAKGYGLDIVCTRSFNHLGPGQTDRFVISSFVKQAVEVSLGLRPVVVCGNVDIIRDFIDVHSVVAAYQCILDKGVSGEIYNVCSGQGVTLRELLKRICHKVRILETFEQDPKLMRPIESPVIIGCNKKLMALGFQMSFDLDHCIDDLIAWWKKELRLSEHPA